MLPWIDECIDEKIVLLHKMKESDYFNTLIEAADAIVGALKSGGKVLTAGNGGSAADAQHFTGEMVGNFLLDRESFASVSLVVDPVVMTSISNDQGYDNTVARQVLGIGNRGDILLTISTSGQSINLIKAIEAARNKGIKSIALIGKDGGEMAKVADYSLIVPSDNTPRIQEIHTFTIHLLCQIIEKEMVICK